MLPFISANAAKEEMVPYFQRIVEALKVYLVQEQSPETLCLQIQAVGMYPMFSGALNLSFISMYYVQRGCPH